MSAWKKHWLHKLDAEIPSLSEDVKNEPINVVEASKIETVKAVSPKKAWFKQFLTSPKRLTACISACVMCLIVFGASLFYILRPNTPITANTVIAVEVNPKAVFNVNENGIVTAVVAANADADVVLSENREAEMEGKTAEEAVRIFVDHTARLGYLDLNASKAVRVTSCEEGTPLEKVGAVLEEYFQEKNAYIAVVKEMLPLQGFCSRIGIVEETLEDLTQSLENMPTFVFEREAMGKSLAQLQTLYRENIPLETLSDLFQTALSSGVEKIQNKTLALEELEKTNEEILSHTIVFDYWALNNTDVGLSGELQNLMVAMDEKLTAYKAAFGVEITSFVMLQAELLECAAAPLQTLTEALSEFTVTIFNEQFTHLANLLEGIGIDTATIGDFYELPLDENEYVNKLNAYLGGRYTRLCEENEAYAYPREEVDKDEYEAHVAGIIAQYGSLTAYWENLQKE